MNRWMAVTIMFVAVSLLAGCMPAQPVVAQTSPALADVPVPTAFKMDPRHSTDFYRDETKERYNNYYFTGRALFADVLGFYRQQMPVEGWRLEQDVGSGDRHTLFFKKSLIAAQAKQEAPTCVVTVFCDKDFATAVQITRVER